MSSQYLFLKQRTVGFNTGFNTRFSILRSLLLSIFGATLLFASAQIYIDYKPVPFTLQTIALMMIGLQYNLRDGLSSVIMYMTAGIAGLPVFAAYSSGIGIIVGPRGGYIIGFVLCVCVMNLLKTLIGSRSIVSILINCFAGTVSVIGCGVSWLTYHIGFENAISYGVIPFIIPGILKSIITAILLRLSGVTLGMRKNDVVGK
jgi:biotin transport system substrate-specific component